MSEPARADPTRFRRSLRHIGRLRLFRSEAGVTAIEYGLIASLIAISIISGISLLGSSPASVFRTLASSL